MKEILASRILPEGIEVRGHVEDRKIGEKALDFFCDKFKKESCEDAAKDTQKKFKVDIHVEREQNKFDKEGKKYDVYIGPKEHS